MRVLRVTSAALLGVLVSVGLAAAPSSAAVMSPHAGIRGHVVAQDAVLRSGAIHNGAVPSGQVYAPRGDCQRAHQDIQC